MFIMCNEILENNFNLKHLKILYRFDKISRNKSNLLCVIENDLMVNKGYIKKEATINSGFFFMILI